MAARSLHEITADLDVLSGEFTELSGQPMPGNKRAILERQALLIAKRNNLLTLLQELFQSSDVIATATFAVVRNALTKAHDAVNSLPSADKDQRFLRLLSIMHAAIADVYAVTNLKREQPLPAGTQQAVNLLISSCLTQLNNLRG